VDADINTTHELHAQIQYRLIEKLSESERRYRELVESLQEIVFKCDLLGRFTFLNSAWTQTLGYSIEESLNQPLERFLHPHDRDRGLQFLVQLQHQQAVIAQELHFQHQNGAIVWLELSARPKGLADLAGSMIDITGRKQAEAALNEANEALEMRVEQRTTELREALHHLQRTQSQLVQTEKISSLGQLVAGVAHEVNNPINFIHGNLDFVQEYTQNLLKFLQLYQTHYPHPVPEIAAQAQDMDLEFLQTDLTKILTSMKMGTDRVRQIVASLRNFSRMDEAEFKPVNIHEGIDSTVMMLQYRLLAQPERAAIEVIQDYAALPAVECYPGQLNQVLMNLLSNAIDALDDRDSQRTFKDTKENPSRITIRTSSVSHQWVRIAIADNGPGIPEPLKQRIFDPFFTTKPIGKGTGIGLSISYQIIVEKHRGTIQCFSQPGQGTEFVIQIPIQQPEVKG
jgi:two-component system, NtrC family, sensor kinase